MASHDSAPGAQVEHPDAGHEVGEPGHRHERPEEWGWHADLGKLARFGGYFSAIALALMLTATHYNNAGTLALAICLALVLGGLVWERQQRRNTWRR
ncbi:MAG: hypothetical protein ACR2KJ_06850 [Jatrophihabitans sp.]